MIEIPSMKSRISEIEHPKNAFDLVADVSLGAATASVGAQCILTLTSIYFGVSSHGLWTKATFACFGGMVIATIAGIVASTLSDRAEGKRSKIVIRPPPIAGISNS
jgi:hypothetical protein